MTPSRLALFYLAGIAIMCVFQLALGADIFMLTALAVVSAGAAIPMSVRTMLVSDALYLVFAFYNGTFSLLIKSAVLQPVDSNLINPRQSAAYLLLGFLSMSLGYFVSRQYRRPARYYQKIATFFNDVEVEALLAKPVFVLGAIFYFLQTVFRSNAVNGGFEEGGFGGFGTFYPLLILGAALQMALYVRRPTRTELVSVVTMGVIVLSLSLAGNVKKTLFDFLLIVTAAFFAFGLRVKASYIIGTLVGVVLMFGYISPAIHIIRIKTDISGADRLTATWQTIVDANFDPVTLSEAEDRISEGYVVSYYGSYIYPIPWNTERFTLVLPVDEVVRALPSVGAMGMPYVLQDIAETILPSVLLSKELITPNDRIAWRFGFRNNGSISRPVVGPIAGAAASYGLVGVLLLPGIVIAIIFSIFNLVSGPMRNNAWGIFMLVATVQLAETEAGTIIIFFCRNFPFILIVATALYIAFHPRMRAAGRPRLGSPSGG